MENLTPSVLLAVRELRLQIGSGKSMRQAVEYYLGRRNDGFASRLREYWLRQDPLERANMKWPSRFQRALGDLIQRGCAGHPTLEALTSLETEIEKAAGFEIEEHLALVPFKILLPLLIFQFPAYLILLMGPLLRELARQMGG